MIDLVVFGTGKIAAVVTAHLRTAATVRIAAYTCDGAFLHQARAGEPSVVAFEEVRDRFPPAQFAMCIALGYHRLNALRAERFEAARSMGYRMVGLPLDAPTPTDSFSWGANCLVLDQAIVQPGARLGDNVAVWGGAVVGHHAEVGDHCWVTSGALIGGGARIGQRCFVGLGAIIGHEVELGSDCVVGAGAIVLKNAPSGSVFITPPTPRFRLNSQEFLAITRLG